MYEDILHIKEKDITTQTFKNPFGKVQGDDVCIISIKEVVGNHAGLIGYGEHCNNQFVNQSMTCVVFE